MLSRQGAQRSPFRSVRMVRLLPHYRPRDEIEQHLQAVLVNGPLPLRVVRDRVVERIMRDEIAHGGWVDDIGLWGWRLYRSDVDRTIRKLDGLMLTIEESAPRS